MKRFFKWLRRGALAVVVLGAGLVAHELWFKPFSIGVFFERVFIEYALDDPQLLSSMRILPGWMNWYGDELTDASLAREDAMREKLHDDLATLRSYDRDALDAGEQVSYDMLEYFLASQVDGDAFRKAMERHGLGETARDEGREEMGQVGGAGNGLVVLGRGRLAVESRDRKDPAVALHGQQHGEALRLGVTDHGRGFPIAGPRVVSPEHAAHIAVDRRPARDGS